MILKDNQKDTKEATCNGENIIKIGKKQKKITSFEGAILIGDLFEKLKLRVSIDSLKETC